MATLVLSQVGNAVGGPLGALAGSVAGSTIDQAIFAAPNLADLTRQGADYGAVIPRVYGTIRVAGNVLWSTGLQSAGFGGKLVGAGTSYATSIAIGVSARPVLSFGRIWADGKLMRDQGQLAVAGQVRFYTGSEDQLADPAIVANEGATNAPSFRGLAYVVFENLSLAAFADRVPTFSFEVTADTAAVAVGAIAADLFKAGGARAVDGSALTVTLDGYGLGRGTTLSGALEQLAAIAPHDIVAGDTGLRLVQPGQTTPIPLLDSEIGAYVGRVPAPVRTWQRASTLRPPQTVGIGYMDAARQYQAGLQTAVGAGTSHIVVEQSLPAVLTAPVARGLAERLLRDGETARANRSVTLGYARAPCEVGDVVTVSADPTLWRVRRTSLEAMVVKLDLEALPTWLAQSMVTDAGQGPSNTLAIQGPTVLSVLDLPDFTQSGVAGPRLWLAVSGLDTHWRNAQLLISFDGGASYSTAAFTRTPTVLGTTTGILGIGSTTGLDIANSVEVALANPNDWLQSRPAASVHAGANLIVIGTELLSFQTAVPTTAGRFMLSGLSRGLFGTEFAVAGHTSGEAFAILDASRLQTLDLPVATLGSTLLIKAVGGLDMPAAITPSSITVKGASLRPISPVNVSVTIAGDGTINATWIRRSRLGFGWPAGSSPPLAEITEAYQIVLTASGGQSATYGAAQPSIAITPAQQLALAGAPITHGRIAVSQVSALVGPGPSASQSF